ncbi:MAG: serine/threonine-protein kinase, partial [Dokdonella sp.]
MNGETEKTSSNGSGTGDSSDATVSAQQWLRLQELFEHLVGLAANERAAWLETTEPDPELRKAALALISADSDNGALLTRRMLSALHDSLGESPINGMQLGNYRLIEEVGSGGMGTVFLAERIDAEFDRRVAIKLIRGIATRDASQRLRRERQILANLSHPNIARLLDGGTSEAGQPYLVMEYIEGSSITEFSRDRALELNQRLRLLQQVCRAVQYAHQRLVIHRDLKPANVLVRHDGTPALLDFGIAKLLDASASGQQTQTALPWFTPAYASPEQRRGEPVSTATDIYGLGSLLHELLTDTVPKPDAEGTLVAPSQLATAGNPTLSDRELDIIVGTATHLDPERRYRSAEALSEDIERYIRRRPIHAAPDTLGYRVAKFIRRNRFATAAVAAAIALSLVFTWRLASERDRAVQAETKAVQESANTQQVVDYLIDLFKAAEPEQAGNKPIDPRRLIDRGRAQIDTRLADQPQQRARLLAALGKIYLELGLPDQAAETLTSAADLEQAIGNPAREATDLADVGFALNVAERPGDAETALRRGIAALDSIAGSAPHNQPDPNPPLRSDLLATLGLAQARNGDPKGGAKSVARAIEIASASDGADSIRVAQHQSALGEVELRAGNLDAAEAAAQRGVDILRAKVADDSPELIAAIGFLTA